MQVALIGDSKPMDTKEAGGNLQVTSPMPFARELCLCVEIAG
jgi:hypothetical protein